MNQIGPDGMIFAKIMQAIHICGRQKMLNRLIKNLKDTSKSPICFAIIIAISFIFAVSSITYAALTVDNAKTASISTGTYGNPVRIARDNAGMLYVTLPTAGKVLVYSKDGALYNSINSIGSPLSIAVDSQNRIYVGDSSDGSVTVLDQSGKYLFKLGAGSGEFGVPGDIAISSGGRVYVTDSRKNLVGYYSDNGSKLGSFGAYGLGAGQMNFPAGIAVDDVNSKVYVVNHNNKRVDIFGLDGNYMTSIGGGCTTNTAGTSAATSLAVADACVGSNNPFDRPQGIAVAEGYMFITDAYSATVRVYDVNGVWKFDVGQYGSGVGDLKVPMDVVKVGTKLYVTNYDSRKIAVFDVKDDMGLNLEPASMSFVVNIDNNPADQVVQVTPQVDGRSLAITSATPAGVLADRISVGGFTGAVPSAVTVGVNAIGLSEGNYAGMVVFHVQGGSDYVLNVTLNVQKQYQLKANPSSVNIVYAKGLSTSVNLDSGNSVLGWTAVKVNADWLDVPSSGTTQNKNVALSLNASADRLSEGVYSGSVTFNAPESINKSVTVPVTLTVKKIYALPGSINLTYKKGSSSLASDAISVSSGGADMQWAAAANVNWVTLSALSGMTPNSINVSLSDSVKSLQEGLYSGQIALSAADAVNQGVVIPVALKVISAGKVVVSTNLDQASFRIVGPTEKAGSGKVWEGDELAPGSYTVVFNNVPGFRKPVSKDFALKTGDSLSIDVQYRQIPMANVIVAAQGPGARNDSTVKVLDFNGNLINEFKAFSVKYGANVAMGDVDGDGSDDIIVGAGSAEANKAEVKVYRYNGSLLASIPALANTKYGANVAAGDVDGSGKYAIAVSMFDQGLSVPHVVVVYSLDANGSMIERSRISVSDGAKGTANVSFGDVNGDGKLELIVVGKDSVSVYTFDTNLVATLVSTSSTSPFAINQSGVDVAMKVAAGDINGDGVDEIILGDVVGNDSVYRVFSGDQSQNLYSINAFSNGKSSSTLSCMDWNGDGVMEMLVGQGASQDNKAVLRIYGSDGNLFKEINAFRASKYGVNAAFGAIK